MTQESKEPQGVVGALPLDRLSKECRGLAGAIGAKMLGSVTDKVTGVTGRLTNYAERGDDPGASTAPKGAEASEETSEAPEGSASEGPGSSGGPGRNAEESKEDSQGPGENTPEEEGKGSSSKPGVLSRAGKAVKKVVGRDGKSAGRAEGDKTRVTNVVEFLDVGAPISVVYNQWTNFADFPSFMKKVENVKQESDEELTWKAQIFWSHRTWKSKIIEQVPDQRIIWRSEGAKGYVDGAVTFHELTPTLTRIVLVLEYNAQGFFEKVGNLWRAQGRRARLEFKHFGRHVMTQDLLHPEEIKGWRGEIHDGQLVKDQDGEAADAERPEGESEGERSKGEQPEGERSEGERPEGEQPEGERSEGERPEGEQPEGERPEQEASQEDRSEDERSGESQREAEPAESQSR
ncbi:SRPBCC family protein [Nonomuraea cavernae]|uniref:Polyketide cyclase n=1 Tax=Nonomuraea cavernae TaxID=2045107 RepID=A0A917Z2H4_9ACTN|nr:SRPBCC family protein [Nonomuraea cavernae]MCA2188439.1 cyclase [Nonomuraea cavernae]GGO73322.1 polyketide cyclase [Nonomuraea cavernae]